MNYPTTRQEAKATGATHYFTGMPCKHGHIALRKTKGVCVECLQIEWRDSNAARALLPKSEASKEAGKRYYEKNKELIILKAMGRTNEDRRRYRNTWKENHPEEVLASTNDRRRRHKNASPRWLSKEQKEAIRQFYKDALTTTRITGKQYVVDHIVPLRSEVVCGLHVPWNLRVITQEENLAKSNKL